MFLVRLTFIVVKWKIRYKINIKETSENSIEGSGLKFHLPIINFPKGMITTKAVKLAYDKFKIKYC